MTKLYHASMGYGFDLNSLNMYLKKMHNKLIEEDTLNLIVDDWRLNNIYSGNADLSSINHKHVHYEKSFYEMLKFEDKKLKEYKLGDLVISMNPDFNYRFNFKHENDLVSHSDLLKMWMSHFN